MEKQAEGKGLQRCVRHLEKGCQSGQNTEGENVYHVPLSLPPSLSYQDQPSLPIPSLSKKGQSLRIGGTGLGSLAGSLTHTRALRQEVVVKIRSDPWVELPAGCSSLDMVSRQGSVGSGRGMAWWGVAGAVLSLADSDLRSHKPLSPEKASVC